MGLLDVNALGKCYHIGTKVRRELWALRDVSFALERGTILGIIGPNGAGKTTLLKVLARVTPPTEGRVVGRGRVVPLLALGAGFQGDLTGRENIFLNAAMYGIDRQEVLRRFDEIVAFSGIQDFIDMPVRRYSSGMFLRLAFSVAINMSPDLLLADEVLAVGDLEFQERCLERVQRAGRDGLGVLFVSHDMAAITRLCDRVLWLNAGEAVRLGTPNEVISEYQESAWTAISKRSKADQSQTNDLGEIAFVKLLSADGREIGATRVVDETIVQIGLRMRHGGIRFRCMVDIFARGVAAFRSVQPEETVVERAGIYTVTVRVPPHLLAETIYTGNVIVKLTSGDTSSSLSWYHALSFPAYGVVTGTSARGTYSAELSGVVSPLLDWRVVQVEQTALTGESS